MRRSEILWLAFEKFAIFFSFVFIFTVVIALLVVAYGAWLARDPLLSVKDGPICSTVTGLNTLLDDFESAVITRTIHISQTIPVQFELNLDRNITVDLTGSVPVNRPATMVLPAGGGRINGTVSMELPRGMRLPIHMTLPVPVDQQLPVEMDVPVSIPLRETDLGGVIQQLRDLLAPLRLQELEETLKCRP
ncbi:MAG TPA: hypothetical protein VLC52_17235 [Anaerolineae bacterium]|nr:hypothetical protein [Anaerolineae bacterium]